MDSISQSACQHYERIADMLIHGILNAQLSAALAGLRHKDVFVVSDCGLPVPQGIEVIDLAVVFGVPRFEEVPLLPMEKIVVGVHFGLWVWGGTFTTSVFWRQMNGFVL